MNGAIMKKCKKRMLNFGHERNVTFLNAYPVFKFQNSKLKTLHSRHAAHHAEAAGDSREHGNDEIDDSFQGFLFHGFNFLNVSFFITLVFPSVSPFPFPIPSLWKRQNDQMTK